MSARKLIISFGPNGTDLAKITAVSEATWEEFAKLLTDSPLETEDKASRGWYCAAEFSPRRRHGENFVARHALTFDYDTITPENAKAIQQAYHDFAYAAYTTWSHTPEKPRLRLVFPTSRPMAADEFCAVSRFIASYANIEWAARESHTVCQFMFQPTKKPGGVFKGKVNKGEWVDPDFVLAQYADWTDHTQWPHRKDHDEQYNKDDMPAAPTTKPGLIGAFNRAFSIPEAIEKFELPYRRVS